MFIWGVHRVDLVPWDPDVRAICSLTKCEQTVINIVLSGLIAMHSYVVRWTVETFGETNTKFDKAVNCNFKEISIKYFYLKYIMFTFETMCKISRSFTIPNFSLPLISILINYSLIGRWMLLKILQMSHDSVFIKWLIICWMFEWLLNLWMVV